MNNILRIPLLLVALLLSSIPIYAHDFEVDGIYYNITSSTNKTVEVTYRGRSYDSYTNEYTGSVTIPSSVTYSETTYSVSSIGNYAFYNCTGLNKVTIPNSVSSIGSSAFKGCSGLTSVTIPNSVSSIGSSAFYECSGLTSVNITDLSAWCKIGFGSFNSNPLYCAHHLKLNGTEITDLVIPDEITEIKDYAFYWCSGLTSVTIGNSVTTIGNSAFYWCHGLTSVNITDLSAWCKINFYHNDSNPLNYAHHLKLNGTEITDLVIPDEITEIKGYAFYGCSGLKSVTIPNSVTSIGNRAFMDCSGLTSVTIPNSVTKIGDYAFYGCDKLIDGSIKETTQTTATFYLTSPTQYNLAVNKTQAENGTVTISGLIPGRNYNWDLNLIINGIFCNIKEISGSTKSFSVNISGSTNATSLSAHGTYTDGDVTIIGEGINYNESVTNYDGKNTITLNNLDPNTTFEIHYAVKTKEGGVYSASKSFTTRDLTWDNGGGIATSTTSARLSVETNCDGTATGFEWKRYDAPESLAPNKAPCPVIDGMLLGSLRNLNPEVYYKCRPYYTSSSGKTYYGEWITFFTGDANVYFEPEVRTFNNYSIDNNSVTVNGYALAGTDDISEQGFEYWVTGSIISPSATNSHMTVKASGISMTATITDLDYNTTYRYRAYAKTAQGTFYGEEEEFSTGENPAGIGYIEIDGNNGIDVKLRENPVSSTAWVKVVGTSATEAEYYILSTGGVMVDNGLIPVDGDYYPIELNIYPGMYFIIVTDGSQRKTQRLIVR